MKVSKLAATTNSDAAAWFWVPSYWLDPKPVKKSEVAKNGERERAGAEM
jgi:hypothetical protein